MNIARLILFACFLLTGSVASAHEMRPALLELIQQSETAWELTFKQPQVGGRFLNLSVSTDCEADESQYLSGSTALQESATLTCDASGPREVTIVGIENTLIDAMITVNHLDGTEAHFLASARKPTITLSREETAVPVYLVLGVEHLVFGIDHVLFVLVLMYLVKGWINLLKVITSFTVAHSLTLFLSALDMVSVAQAPVEALIALSIVLLAAESQRPQESMLAHNPWIVTFVFGLLHGLGFAGVLGEIGLPASAEVWALFLFNVGIELGQIAIVALALGVVWLVTRAQPVVHPVLAHGPVYAIGGLASFWFIERSAQVLL